MFLPAILLFLIVSVCYFYFVHKYLMKRKRMHEYGNKIDGPKPLPIVGSALDVPKDSFEFLPFAMEYAKNVLKNGDSVMRMWIMDNLYIMPLNGEALKPIIESNHEITKSHEYDFFLPWLGTGLLLSTDDKWRGRRKMLTPSFHFKMLEGFFEVFNKEMRIFVENLENFADGRQEVNLYPLIKHAALDIICGTAMGIELNAQVDPNQPYVKAVEEYNRLAFEFSLNPLNWISLYWHATGKAKKRQETLKTLLGFTQKVIDERAEIFDDLKNGGQKEGKKHMAFLDMLLNMKDENQLTNEDIREEVDTFMFEGHDTTSSGIGWTCWCLATHPEIQEKVYQEIYQHFGDLDRDVTIDDLKELKYLERCLKEAMRLFPPVPSVLRTLKDDIELGGKLAPSGATIVINAYVVQRNPKTYPNPEEYNPDNFLPEKAAARHPYDYIPFSAGPRNCIGQKFAFYEEKVAIIYILKNFKLSTHYKIHDNLGGNESILRPKMGIPVKVERRN